MNELVEKTESSLEVPRIREGIMALEKTMKACPEAFTSLEVMHHFTDGIYSRTCLMHKGELIVGKIHKKEHLVVVSAGHATVVSEEFGNKEIVAPAVFKSPPGVKRVLLIKEDMVWTTIHKNESNTQDMDVLEDELIAKEYSEVSL